MEYSTKAKETHKAVPAKTIKGLVPTGIFLVLNWLMLRKVSPSKENSSMSSIL